jgi:hypothetical protein
VSRPQTTTENGWSQLGRQELIARGRTLVRQRLERLGAAVQAPGGRAGGRLEVTTPSGRELEVFVSTQRVGGYAFWTKQRFEPAGDRLVAIVLLGDAAQPELYLVPSTEWRDASPPLTDRDNVGKASAPEYGISLARSWLPTLQRYRWDEATADERFR